MHTALSFAAVTLAEFQAAHRAVKAHAHRTPLLRSRMLSERSGFDVHLKAELFQRTGSYKVRGPLNKFRLMDAAARARGVICSSAGNHAQGVALAAAIHHSPAVVVMASNATASKIEATRAYGAEVVLHGLIWDDANAKAQELMAERGLTYIHPFDDPELVAGQGTVGLEILEDLADVDVIVVPIGGGGLISGVAMAAKALKPSVRIIGVESSGAPGMQASVRAGHVVTLDTVDCVIDGLRVKRVGTYNVEVALRFVDDIVTLPDRDIFDAVTWVMHHCKLVVEGAAAAPVAAILHGLIAAAPGARVVAVLSGGNLDLSRFAGGVWN